VNVTTASFYLEAEEWLSRMPQSWQTLVMKLERNRGDKIGVTCS
jgi:hypothetical protein